MTNVTLSNLDLTNRFVALEAVDVFHAGSVGIQKFAELAADTSAFISQQFSQIKVFFSDSNVGKEFQQFDAFAKRHKYFDVRNIHVVVPEGFEGSYEQYVALLLKITQDFSLKFVSELVVPYDLYISKLINNPALLESSNYHHSIKSKDVEKYKKDIAKFFKPNGKFIETKLGDVFGNMGAITRTATEANRLMLAIKTLDIAKVKTTVDLLNNKLNMLADMVNSETNNINVNAKMLSQLSQLTFDIARYAEFFAVLETLTGSLLSALRANNKVFIDVK